MADGDKNKKLPTFVTVANKLARVKDYNKLTSNERMVYRNQYEDKTKSPNLMAVTKGADGTPVYQPTTTDSGELKYSIAPAEITSSPRSKAGKNILKEKRTQQRQMAGHTGNDQGKAPKTMPRNWWTTSGQGLLEGMAIPGSIAGVGIDALRGRGFKPERAIPEFVTGKPQASVIEGLTSRETVENYPISTALADVALGIATANPKGVVSGLGKVGSKLGSAVGSAVSKMPKIKKIPRKPPPGGLDAELMQQAKVDEYVKSMIEKYPAQTKDLAEKWKSGDPINFNELYKKGQKDYTSNKPTFTPPPKFKPPPTFTSKRKEQLLDPNLSYLEQTASLVPGIKQHKKNILNDLSSEEGLKRLKNQEYDYFKREYPKLDEKTLQEYAEQAALSRIKEVKHTKILNTDAEKLLEESKKLEKQGKDASPVLLDDFEYRRDKLLGKIPFDNAQFQGTGRQFVGVKDNPLHYLNAESQDSYLTFGAKYYGSNPTIDHEYAHLLQSGRVLPIDDEFKKLIKPKWNYNYGDISAYDSSHWGTIDRLKTKYNFLKGDNWDNMFESNYFKKGSQGMEPSAFGAELRQSLLDRGLIKSRYEEITPEKLKIAYKSFKKNPTGVGKKTEGTFESDTRIFDFMQKSKSNFKNLSNLLNKLPTTAGAVGTGALLGKEKETYRYGGVKKKIPTSKLGQWKYPNQVVKVPGNNITMQGINHPNLGVADTGEKQIMMPGMNYHFKGAKEVTEYPMKAKYGGSPQGTVVEVEGDEIGVVQGENGFEKLFQTPASTPSHKEGGVDVTLPNDKLSMIFPKKYLGVINKALYEGDDKTIAKYGKQMKAESEAAGRAGLPYSNPPSTNSMAKKGAKFPKMNTGKYAQYGSIQGERQPWSSGNIKKRPKPKMETLNFEKKFGIHPSSNTAGLKASEDFAYEGLKKGVQYKFPCSGGEQCAGGSNTASTNYKQELYDELGKDVKAKRLYGDAWRDASTDKYDVTWTNKDYKDQIDVTNTGSTKKHLTYKALADDGSVNQWPDDFFTSGIPDKYVGKKVMGDRENTTTTEASGLAAARKGEKPGGEHLSNRIGKLREHPYLMNKDGTPQMGRFIPHQYSGKEGGGTVNKAKFFQDWVSKTDGWGFKPGENKYTPIRIYEEAEITKLEKEVAKKRELERLKNNPPKKDGWVTRGVKSMLSDFKKGMPKYNRYGGVHYAKYGTHNDCGCDKKKAKHGVHKGSGCCGIKE